MTNWLDVVLCILRVTVKENMYLIISGLSSVLIQENGEESIGIMGSRVLHAMLVQ